MTTILSFSIFAIAFFLNEVNTVQLRQEKISENMISKTNVTVTYQPNPLYQTCTCDLTALSCDAFCCCDQDCSFALRSQWVSNKVCVNYNYDTAIGKPLTDCLKQQAMYDFNKMKGVQDYIDPFARLFCVKINNSPHMDLYWVDKTDLTNEDIDQLLSDPEKQGFERTIYGSNSPTDPKTYYSEGNKMLSILNNNLQQVFAFSIPRPDLNGACDNSQSPSFMENSETECIQVFDIQKDCLSVVNPTFYSQKLGILNGTSSIAGFTPVETTDLYFLNRFTRQYTQGSDLSSFKGSNLIIDNITNMCTCQNVLKEIHYQIQVQPNQAKDKYSDPYFKIQRVTATVVAADDNITVPCGQLVQIQQKYSVQFITSGTQPQAKSGNPGYILRYPMLLGAPTPQGMQVYQKGFELKGSDEKGFCNANVSSYNQQFDYGDPIVTFGNNLIYGCAIDMTFDEFKQFCQDPKLNVTQLQIFTNLDFFQRYGEFGNANIYYSQDWKNVKIDESFDHLGEAISWDGNSCHLYSNVHYKVYYSKMGFSDNPQKYIVDIYKFAIPEIWTFQKSQNDQKQKFAHQVSFEFIEITSTDAKNSTFIDPIQDSIPLDAFYPFIMTSQANIFAVMSCLSFCMILAVNLVF